MPNTSAVPEVGVSTPERLGARKMGRKPRVPSERRFGWRLVRADEQAALAATLLSDRAELRECVQGLRLAGEHHRRRTLDAPQEQ